MIKNLCFVIFAFITVSANAQIGGTSTYNFLNLPTSARIASLGGTINSILDDDINLTLQNPSLLNPKMHNHVSLSYINYFTDINFGYAGYSRDFGKVGSFAAGIHYVNYGEFKGADEKGIETGTFEAAEYAIQLSWAKSLDSLWHFGISAKPVISHLERYTSYGIVSDIGLTYFNPESQFGATLLVRNLGTQITTYNDDNYEPMPFEIQAGISKRLNHAPFRLSVALSHLQKFDLTYTTPEEEKTSNNLFPDEETKENPLLDYVDMGMRHVIFGIEFLPFENVAIRVGYNHRRRQELSVVDKSGLVGFSWGFGFKISKFRLSYGRARYHLAGASNHFSLTMNLSEMKTFRKKV